MNEVHVDLDELGRVRLRRAGKGSGVYTLETTEALRAFFQAERDDALGRWRDTENTDMVAYRMPEDDDEDGRCVLVLDENTGHNYYEWERVAYSGSGLRYFAAHPEPEPRPWEEAKVGEIWEIGLLELGPSACLVTEGDFVEISGRFELAIGSSLIESGRRIWPTDAEGDGDE